jgi:alpha 1,2-mannosyltransferase
VKSSFSEVLYLDSDNILLADPTFLFDHPIYREHGVVFWPDITKDVGFVVTAPAFY